MKVITRFDGARIALEKGIVPDIGKNILCDKCGRPIGVILNFIDQRIFCASQGQLKIVCGSDPKTGFSEKFDFVLCYCLWDSFSKNLSEIQGGEIYSFENAVAEEGKGYFVTGKEVTLGTNARIIFRLQMEENKYTKTLSLVRGLTQKI